MPAVSGGGRRLLPAGATLLAVLVLPCALVAQREEEPPPPRLAGLLLQEAYYEEVAQNDYSEAIRLYERVLAIPAVPRREAAQAQLRRAVCLRILGRWLEARTGFEAVLEQFSAEPRVREIATRYVSQTARLFPDDTLFFLELVKPGLQVDYLAELIRGTALEAAEEGYMAPLPRDPSRTIPPRFFDQLAPLRALLDGSLLKELNLLDGYAFGAMPLENGGFGLLTVLLTGESNTSRGVVRMLTHFFLDGPAETFEGMSLFRRPDPDAEPLFLATDSQTDVVFFGSPLAVVKEGIRRYRSGARAGSLASERDFQRALEARAGSLLFAYLRGSTFLSALESVTPPSGHADLLLARQLLGFDAYEALALTASLDRDRLRIRFSAKAPLEPDDPASALPWATGEGAILPSILFESIAAEPLAFAAFCTARLAEDWPDVQAIVGAAPAAKESAAIVPARLGTLLGSEAAHAVVALSPALRAMAVCLPQLPEPAGADLKDAVYFAATLLSEVSREDIEPRIAALLRASHSEVRAASAGTEPGFRDAPNAALGGDPPAAIRVLEIAPGTFAAYARRGTSLLIAPRAATLPALLARLADAGPLPPEERPVAANKAFFVRLDEVADLLGADLLGHPFLSGTSRLHLSTHEAPGQWTVDALIPDAKHLVERALALVSLANGDDAGNDAAE